MRVLCRSGHFAFYPRIESEIPRFASYFKQELVRDGDFYTFPFLKSAPKYSLKGKAFLGLPALKTFEGEPWEVMKENGFVYNIQTKLVVPKLSIVSLIEFTNVTYYFIAHSPLVQPGSRLKVGSTVLSYDGEFVQSFYQLRINGFSNE